MECVIRNYTIRYYLKLYYKICIQRVVVYENCGSKVLLSLNYELFNAIYPEFDVL
jgi:hypothetical protein